MKIFVGIDFSKEKFDAAVIDADFTKSHTAKCNVFENSALGAEELLKWIRNTHPKFKRSDIIFCGENTGVYSRPVADYLLSKDYKICLENSYRIQRSSGLIRGKNDQKDAIMIAEYVFRHSDKVSQYNGENKTLKNLDLLFKQRRLFVKQKTEIKCKLESLDFEGKKVKDFSLVLDDYCVVKNGEIRLKLEKISKLSLSEISLVQSLAMLKIYECNIAELDKKMKQTVLEDDFIKENYDIVTSIPGIALQNAVALLIYTENFERFGFDARKLASYYGVAVFGKQSGTSVYSAPHTSHLANKQLKSLLSQAALISTVYCAPIKAYYERLIERGKKPQIVLNNVKNKLLHMIMSMVKNKTKYDENIYGKSSELYNAKGKSVFLENN